MRAGSCAPTVGGTIANTATTTDVQSLTKQTVLSLLVDPTDRQGTKTIQKFFQFELAIPATTRIRTLGGRIYVRFDHGNEPIIQRWLRQARQLFLSKLYG